MVHIMNFSVFQLSNDVCGIILSKVIKIFVDLSKNFLTSFEVFEKKNVNNFLIIFKSASVRGWVLTHC